MFRKAIAFSFFILGLAACQAVSKPDITYDPADLSFSGERAFELETAYVQRFPNRVSGQPNNRAAAEWFFNEFSRLGWACSWQEWEIVNYSRDVPLQNAVCRLEGASSREILVAVHHDQASTTVEGADNDASGVAILTQLGEIFAAEAPLPYTLVFISTDAEEYGMLGSLHYIQTHPNLDSIIAGFSLDNLGRSYYDGLIVEGIGQFRRYSPIWLPLLVRDAAQTAGADWQVYLRAPLDQAIDQAGPISFMDQGPMVAAGIPALGLAGHVPAVFADEHYRLWHDPDDTIDTQSAESLGQAGLITEAVIRQLLSMDSFPDASGPYLYFTESGQTLTGWPLWLIFIAFVALFFLGSFVGGKTTLQEKVQGWSKALPHFLGLWLPLLGAIILLYLFVAVGLMEEFELYPATTKDPSILNPRWPAITLFLVGLVGFLWLGRRLTRRFTRGQTAPSAETSKSFALFIIGLSSIYILLINPFSLLFCVPVLFWFLIKKRSGAGKALNILLFLLGGLFFYALVFVFGFQVLRYDFVFLWFLMMMFSIGMISFPTSAAITAILGAGLTLVVNAPARE